MKRKFTLLLGTLLCFSLLASSQKILMKIQSVTPSEGEEILALEFGIEAATSYLKGAGAAVGKPTPGPLTIKKKIGLSTDKFLRNIVSGVHSPSIVFEYYDNSNYNYYTITLGNAFVTEMKWLSPECPTCLALEHQIGIVFKTIEFDDKVTQKKTTWDISAMQIQ